MNKCYILLGYKKILFFSQKEKKSFDRDTLEDVFVPYLVDQAKKYDIDMIYVITGPGGFTNLRVASLSLNLLSNYIPQLSYKTISKIDLYKILYKKSLIPSLGLIYIGQKKNIRLFDLQKNQYDLVSKEYLSSEDLFTDPISDYFHKDLENNKLSFDIKDQELSAFYKDKSIELLDIFDNIQPLKTVDPSYMIDPI